MTHSFINIAAPLPRDQEEEAVKALDKLGNPLKGAAKKAIDALGCIHFFSMTIVPGDPDYPPYLVLELSVDGEEKAFLKKLAESAGEHFEPVFKLASDYGESADLASYWRSHLVHTGFGYLDVPGVAHTGTPGMSVERIHKEAELSRVVTALFKETPRDGAALEVLERVREALYKKKKYEWAFTPEDAPLLHGEKPGSLVANILSRWPGFVTTFLWPFLLIGFLISAVMILPDADMDSMGEVLGTLIKLAVMMAITGGLLSLIFIGFVYTRLRALEESDLPDDTPPNHAKLSAIRMREDIAFQNHLAGVSILKTGWVRQITIRLIYWLIAAAATAVYRPGFLGSIGTIHFARWFVLPGTNRLLFFSNYGGSWESYLEDFITKANFGLTGVWSNTLGFPKTSNLLFDGASDGDRFKRWARRQQNPTWCWYCAYPDQTTARIRTNAAIRQGIAGAATETEARDWLMLFGSNVLPRTELQHDNVQGILFGGFGPLPHAACLSVRLPEDPVKARDWLAEIAPQLTYGDYKPGSQSAMICSLAATGLRKLGLSESELATFPHAFAEGMAARARILGDRGENAPEKWVWGGEQNPVDAALLIYAPDDAALDKIVKEETKRLKKHGGAPAKTLELATLPPRGTPVREPFGFVDGVSQPVMRGTGRHRPGTRSQHIVEPGEFILGYPDGLGTYPQSPQVPALADPANDLYAVSGEWPAQRPDFSQSLAPAARDLGRDGSFMVIRQLEQDVESFHAFVDDAVEQLNTGACPLNVNKRWVGAKLVGRWDDGSSLVRNQYEPATNKKADARPDNDFLLGKEDPQGLRCPYGSHIRRSNPRDSFTPGSEEQLDIINRHRILRAGRVYEEDGKKGLLFVCLNGDIERQFEFIQQTWSIATTFHGLDGETDPFINDTGKESRYSIPMMDGTRTITGLSSFVTTKGGEYFFVPGRQTVRFLTRTR
ncbi:MAG: hypothetical protein KDJ75_05340 [Alphaproteobacteria bacterium]|nr:hypothetical protein [Alphaproteobacteria bacterium]